MSGTVADYKGTVTIRKVEQTKEQIFELAKTLFPSVIVCEEVGLTKENEPYAHFHVGYMTPHKPDEERIREVFGAVYISQHRPTASRRTVAWYVCKENKEPLIFNWDTWRSDMHKGKSEAGQGIK